jgi:hypothetical protein
MNNHELVEQLNVDGRPIVKSLALMFEHNTGLDLCGPLAALLYEYLAKRELETAPAVTSVHKALAGQFSLEVGLFNLMHGNTDRAIDILKISADEGNHLAGIALWVVDMKWDSEHLSKTRAHHSVLESIGWNKCHVAFWPVVEADSRESDKLWEYVLARLHHAFEIGVYVRGVLNLICGNHSAALSDMTRVAEETRKTPVREDVAALRMWNGWFEAALRDFRIVARKQGQDSWSHAYAQALESYLTVAAVIR